MVLFLLTPPKSGHLTGTEHPHALQHAEQILGSSELRGFIFLTSVAVIMLHFDYKLGVFAGSGFLSSLFTEANSAPLLSSPLFLHLSFI